MSNERCTFARPGERARVRDRRHHARMRMHDVEPLSADDVANARQSARRDREAGARRKRRADAMHGDSVHLVGTAGGRHDARVDPAHSQCEREIPQVQLDSTHARQEPVADQGDPHRYRP